MRARDVEKGVIKAGTTVWKKVYKWSNIYSNGREFILEMIVLEDGIIPTNNRFAGKVTGTARKCRVPLVYVKAAYPRSEFIAGSIPYGWQSAKPENDAIFADNPLQAYGDYVYTVGTIAKPDSYDDNPMIECTNGIHCFLTRKEAEAY